MRVGTVPRTILSILLGILALLLVNFWLGPGTSSMNTSGYETGNGNWSPSIR